MRATTSAIAVDGEVGGGRVAPHERQLEVELVEAVGRADVAEADVVDQRAERRVHGGVEAGDQTVDVEAVVLHRVPVGPVLRRQRSAERGREVGRGEVDLLEDGVDERAEAGAARHLAEDRRHRPEPRLLCGRSSPASRPPASPAEIRGGVSSIRSSSMPRSSCSGAKPATWARAMSWSCAAAVSAEYEVRRHRRSSGRSKRADAECDAASEPNRTRLRRCRRWPPRRRWRSAARWARTSRMVRALSSLRRGRHLAGRAGRTEQERAERRLERAVRRRPPRDHLVLGPGQGDVREAELLATRLGDVAVDVVLVAAAGAADVDAPPSVGGIVEQRDHVLRDPTGPPQVGQVDDRELEPLAAVDGPHLHGLGVALEPAAPRLDIALALGVAHPLPQPGEQRGRRGVVGHALLVQQLGQVA